MDNLVMGLIVVLALAYIGNKFDENKCLVKVAVAVVAVAPSLAKNLLVCGGNCSCDGSNKALGIKRYC